MFYCLKQFETFLWNIRSHHKDGMIKASSLIPRRFFDQLDEVLYELAPSNWVHTIKNQTSDGQLDGYFENQQLAASSIKFISEFSSDGIPFNFLISEIKQEDWQNSYKKHFQTWEFKGIYIIPVWQKGIHHIDYEERALYLDPSMAFGTGNHETTKMCVESLITLKQSYKEKINSLLDVGCGSGILTLLGDLLSININYGIDSDSNSIKVANDNLLLNKLNFSPKFRVKGIEDLELTRLYDVVIANIQADILCANATKLISCMAENGHMILSGILSTEVDEVQKEFADHTERLGCKMRFRKKHLNEWSTIHISKES